jgi:hypothetical protein
MTFDEDPFISFGTLEAAEQTDVILALLGDARDRHRFIRQLSSHLSAIERRVLVRELASFGTPPTADANGQSMNRIVLSLTDRRSMLWLHRYVEPRAMPGELAFMFGVSQQRASQVLGARGHSNTDEALLRAFNAASQDELKKDWRNQGDIEKLKQHRNGRLLASPLVPRSMTSQVTKTGRWRVYGHSFEVRERDGAYFIVMPSLFGIGESQPRNTGEDALNDAVTVIREEAQVTMSPLEWKAVYKEDFYGTPLAKNLFREGDL